MNYSEWKIFDHKWNNFKRWAEAMYKKKNKPFMTVDSLMRMIETCEKMDEYRDDAFLDTFKQIIKENPRPSEKR